MVLERLFFSADPIDVFMEDWRKLVRTTKVDLEGPQRRVLLPLIAVFSILSHTL